MHFLSLGRSVSQSNEDTINYPVSLSPCSSADGEVSHLCSHLSPPPTPGNIHSNENDYKENILYRFSPYNQLFIDK